MSYWTYLYRPDNGKIFAVIDLADWRESSRRTQGFSEAKTMEIISRPLTASEERDYSEMMRLYSCAYGDVTTLLNDESRIAGEAFSNSLREAIEKVKSTP